MDKTIKKIQDHAEIPYRDANGNRVIINGNYYDYRAERIFEEDVY